MAREIKRSKYIWTFILYNKLYSIESNNLLFLPKKVEKLKKIRLVLKSNYDFRFWRN